MALKKRDFCGRRLGFDMNVMAAWPFVCGEGIIFAVPDSSLDVLHPRIGQSASRGTSLNFHTRGTNATPFGGGITDPLKKFRPSYRTSVPRLIAAEANNNGSMVGVVPLAKLAICG